MTVLESSDRFAQWDKTAAIMGAIERRARIMKHEAGEMQELLGDLKERPDFLSECEHKMRTLEQDLAVLYAFTKACNEIFHKLPETA